MMCRAEMILSLRWREDLAITFGTLFGPLFFILVNTVGASVGFAMADGTDARPITAESAGGKETAVAWVSLPVYTLPCPELSQTL